jgi:hypothetical protein
MIVFSGDWGFGDWGLGPIPNPQSPIPNPQSPGDTFERKYYCVRLRGGFLIKRGPLDSYSGFNKINLFF